MTKKVEKENTLKADSNLNVLYGVIIALLIVIAIGSFFLGKKMGTSTTVVNNNTTNTVGTGTGATADIVADLTITIIDDKRCESCQTQLIVDNIKQLPELANAEYVLKDFSDDGVESMLVGAGIKTLPAVLFSHKEVGENLNPYLTELGDSGFSLALGSTYNPFLERSEKGFLILPKEELVKIKENSYIKGNNEAKITWLEYSDLECPYCAKLHENGTPNEVTKKYGDKLNVMFQHFPLDFHANALPGAQILECLGEQKGSDGFYSLITKSFEEKNSTKTFLIDEAVVLGANKENLEKCLDENKFKSKVENQLANGSSTFGITGTPGNVIINNETGEYEVISGAYPTATFVEAIDKLLAE